MSTTELKRKLIAKISESNDPNLLKEVFRLLEIESEDIEIHKLSVDQRKRIDKAREEIKDGKFISNDEADTEIDEWLKK